MDRRNQPHEFWGASVGWWWRMWQLQMEQGLRFWAAMAAGMPHQGAAELAAEADLVKSQDAANAARGETPAKPAPSAPASSASAAPRRAKA